MPTHIYTLTPTEEQLMLVIWKLGTFRVKDLLASHPAPVPHPNTISTYLKILKEKGFLQTEKIGRIFEYKAKVHKETYIKRLTQHIIQDFFENSAEDFTKFLAKNQMIITEMPIIPAENLIKSKKKKKKKKKKEK